MTLGQRIQNLRKSNNLSQEDLAIKIKVSRQAVSKWEGDLSRPDIDNIIKMSEIFDVSTDFLLLGKEAESKNDDSKFDLLGYLGLGLIVIGLVLGIALWYEYQLIIYPALGFSIQVLGLILVSIASKKSEFKVRNINKISFIMAIIFMPVSFITGLICIYALRMGGAFSPYPHDIIHIILFAVFMIVLSSYFLYKYDIGR